MLVSLIIFILIPVATLSSFRPPPKVCELSALSVSVDVAGQPVDVEFPLEEPIQVELGDLVIITVKIETGPEGCEGAFSVDWRLLFESNPSQVELSRFPMSEVLEIGTGASTSDDLVMLTVKDPSGDLKKRVFLPLKVKGE